MKAMAVRQFGDVDVFEEITLAKPKPTKGTVLIRVKATSVNPLDCKLRTGVFPHLVTSFPMVLHGDVAGIVEAVGEDVTAFAAGDEVYGCAGGLLAMQGALAEYMLVDAKLIAHKPRALSMLEAAALPLVSLTAWEALITRAQVQPNQSVLIHAGIGGVGHIAIQLAKAFGARVYTTVSTAEKMEMVAKLGVDAVINYKKTSVESYVSTHTDGKGFDVVFDTVGGENLSHSFQAVAMYGQIISIQAGGNFDLTPAFIKSASIHLILQPLPLITGERRAHYGDILKKIAHLVDQGKISPLIDRTTFTIQQAAKAHKHLESGQAFGKVVLAGY